MSTSPEGIYEKGVIDPGFPIPLEKSTKPFWLTEPSKINNLQSPWKDSADIVIIGSGMTAVSLARTLYSKRPDSKIIIVEARTVCSGATGRNGGHLKAMSPGVWFDRVEQFGVKEALQIMEFEHSHFAEMTRCIKENKIDCDLHLLEGLDVYFDEKVFQRARDAIDAMREHAPDLASRYTVYTSKSDFAARSLPEACIGAVGMQAASMWPYKFVTALLQKMVNESGLSIQTSTVVTEVIDMDGDDFATVKTSRGNIRAKHVVHATNCWMSHLVPELRPLVSPVRANVQRKVPQPVRERADNSWWLRYGEKDYDYMIQRPDGAFIVGRANTGRRATSNDGELDFLPHKHLQGVTPQVFDFGSEKIDITHAWSGAVAFTQDGNPFVGRLPFPNRRHQWVSACYQGIGMVRAFRSAEMLAYLMLKEELPALYPRSMLLTDSRLKVLQSSLKSKL